MLPKHIRDLCERVRTTAYAIHCYHRHGHRERIYENALAHRLRKLGCQVEQQKVVKVFDEDGTLIGEEQIDLFVDGVLIVETKAARSLVEDHVSQLLGYLKSCRIEHGLLINFGSYRFQCRKYIWSEGFQAPNSETVVL
ncbi:MAG: GxxExxY protein [Verrucomicrobia bacterium]|nr:GxxExxY protein [Verrucomicrobiota bacterium]